ncbi:D-glycero-D-manno-heptose 1,7-bisphosphate phosphatase [Chitinivorax tropicus]|uniref:D,D-heptose 1,7-bisphosphate phosphatase n=1 Tax=Chitinivorax tropicus TaxID=714531 RepID=A0A840MNJ0_9PROT|nr:D-glycero-beta-D-manno-heptose 1,7-bisphosphate 7-phosphatase [Chitinivorax tropicus]MBB5019035.1 D-glycero-D-manno-heptose 1,7-bisphosphate phosphatase [Chitinivorax tropicus]
MKFVILDRDGVINYDSAEFIKNPDEWQPLPGSLEAIALLNQAGYRVVVATNQSGIGRGLFDMSALNAMHQKMHKLLSQSGGRVDAVFFCPHTAKDACNCRKPETGMFEQIADRFGIRLTGVPGIGDSLRDLEAIHAMGGQPILVLTGKGEKTKADGNLPEGTLIFDNLQQAAEYLAKLPEDE